MGQRLTRPFRNLNVESRAAKAIERQQNAPKAAPKHASTVDMISQIQQETPEVLDEMEKRHEGLHENLKKLYVDSKDPPIKIQSTTTAAQLSRRGTNTPSDLDLGVMDLEEGVKVPKGRVSLKEVMAFIAGYQTDPSDNHSVSAIAERHSLDQTQVQNVLTHFKVMQLHIPKEMHEQTKNMGKIIAEQRKSLEGIAATGFKLEEKLKDKLEKKEPTKSIIDSGSGGSQS